MYYSEDKSAYTVFHTERRSEQQLYLLYVLASCLMCGIACIHVWSCGFDIASESCEVRPITTSKYFRYPYNGIDKYNSDPFHCGARGLLVRPCGHERLEP